MPENWIDPAGPVRKGEELPIASLQEYLLENLPGATGELTVEQFPRGFSNLTYLIHMGGKAYVLRRPPFGAQIKTGHDMLREYTILNALKKRYKKAPSPLLYTDDEHVIGAPFYVMERVQGVILRAKMPAEMRPDAEKMSGIAESLIDTFVELHSIDYEAAGLKSLGKPAGYVERQISGWTKRYFKAETDEVSEIEKVARWLAGHQPPEAGVALIHNDFKYDNVVLDSQDWTRIIAVLDWELATLGDPLMDLGASLGYWVNADDPPWLQKLALSPTTLPGNPSRAEVVHMYSQKSGRNVDNAVFYYVYGLFKVAVIVQQIYYRYRKGLTHDTRFANFDQVVKGLGTMALLAIERNKLDGLF